MKIHTIDNNYTTIQMKIPLDLVKIIDISDPVYSFNAVMERIDLRKYYVKKESVMGRPQYDGEKLLKVALFAYMENGYASLRNIEGLCKRDIRYVWLIGDSPAPSYGTICNFMNKSVGRKIEDLFNDIAKVIFEEEGVDLNRLYIDGTKIEANANKYTWVWKKSCQRSREKVYGRITELISEINEGEISFQGLRIEPREEYAIEYLEEVIKRFRDAVCIRNSGNRGRGHHKTVSERQYDQLVEYLNRLMNYAERIEICGEERNSYSKTDHDATFMRVKRDYMGNDQLLPAYNMQIGVCDEYIAVVDAKRYAADMDCFVPLLEKFKAAYGKYPQYPVADAGYGSYNNYLYCEKHGIEKYMKFTTYEKETGDPKYREDPYRAVNFTHDEEGNMICPEGRKFEFIGNRPVKGNKYGRTEEHYKCTSCEGCPQKDRCCRGNGDRTVNVNRELSAIHREVIENLQTELGTLLRRNRTIQAEGTFGSIKWNRSYKRLRRRGLESVIFEFTLIAIGFNLYKYHNKRHRLPAAA